MKDFVLVNKDLADVSLSQFKGKKVLATVPSIDTPTCSLETKKMNDLAKKYPNVSFLVISKDLPFAQTRFCGQEGLANVHLLSDLRPDSTFANDYHVLITKGAAKGLLTRAVFVLNEENEIIYKEFVEKLPTEPNYETLQSYLS